MNILHVYKDYFPVLGGIENHVRTLAESQAAAGHEVTVCVCNPACRSVREHRGGVLVVKSGRLGTLASMPISAAHPLAISRIAADLVHVQSPYPLGEVSAWLLKRKTPLVISYQSDIVRQKHILRFYGPLLRQVLGRADLIIANSPRYLETSPWLQPVRHKCVCVPIGVDQARFSPPGHPFNGPPTILFVGRLRYYKGLPVLLQAMRALPDARLNIVGDGPMLEALQNQVEALQLAPRVHFLTAVDDAMLPGLYRQAHLFALPSNARSEAYGIVLVEAMASGLPCVTTELGTGTSWLVEDGVSGRVVPPNDPQALAAALRALLEDPERMAEMGRAGRARVEAELTQQQMTQRILDVYGMVGL